MRASVGWALPTLRLSTNFNITAYLCSISKILMGFSFPRSSVGMPSDRSSGPGLLRDTATLERLDVLPRRSVGARAISQTSNS